MVEVFVFVFFFKQKTAYEIRPCDWSSDVCSSDLHAAGWVTEIDAEARGRLWWRSEERRVGKSVRSCVDLGGRRIIKKKKNKCKILSYVSVMLLIPCSIIFHF